MFTFGRNSKIEELERIIKEYQDRLYSFAYFRTGSFETAQDMVQEVFLQLCRQHSRLSAVRNLKSYLFRTLSNRCADYKRKVRPTLSIDSVRNVVSDEQKPFYDEYIAIEDVLREVPPDQSEILRMHFVDDLAFVEIAAILNMSVNTVKSRYRYGIEKLRNSSKFKNYDHEE